MSTFVCQTNTDPFVLGGVKGQSTFTAYCSLLQSGMPVRREKLYYWPAGDRRNGLNLPPWLEFEWELGGLGRRELVCRNAGKASDCWRGLESIRPTRCYHVQWFSWESRNWKGQSNINRRHDSLDVIPALRHITYYLWKQAVYLNRQWEVGSSSRCHSWPRLFRCREGNCSTLAAEKSSGRKLALREARKRIWES